MPLRSQPSVPVELQLTLGVLRDQRVDHHVAWAGIEGDHLLRRRAARNGRDVGDAADVEGHAAQAAMAEQQVVHERNQRRAVPSGRNVPGTEIGDHRNSGSLRDHRGLADLQRAGDLAPQEADGRAFVMNGLAVAGDQFRTRLALHDGLGVQLAQQEMQPGDVRRARHGQNRLPHALGIRRRVKGLH